MASEPQLSINAFPAWARVNDVDFIYTKLEETDGRGLGLVAAQRLDSLKKTGDGEVDNRKSSEIDATIPSINLLRVPHDLVLSAEAVDEYAKVDQNFRQLLDIAGHQLTRGDILLYLLTHLILPRRHHAASRSGVSTPWTEYIKFLPRNIPVPTMWTEHERALLEGTSLEAALEAKLSTLTTELDELREKTSELRFWNTFFWESGHATIEDWVLVDAWYRSRSLELPGFGVAMVPALDMVNHSANPTAFYGQDHQDDIVLTMRPGLTVESGEEITITYGETKSAAEMLFSYGFIDLEHAKYELKLPLEALPEDPLGRAKLHIARAMPSVNLRRTEGVLAWNSPFAYLMVLNEEDGLEFRLLQDKDGERQLKLFWQEEDVTERSDEFESLIRDHDLRPVFQLRVVAVLHELVTTQLARLERSEFDHDDLKPLKSTSLVREEPIAAAKALRVVETSLLESAAEALDAEKSHLLADDRVVAYLGLMEVSQSEQAPASSTNSEDDFS